MPLPQVLDHYMRARPPAKHWFLRIFFRRQFKDYQRTLDCNHKRFDQTLFKEKVCVSPVALPPSHGRESRTAGVA
jgi:hypothetical protein